MKDYRTVIALLRSSELFSTCYLKCSSLMKASVLSRHLGSALYSYLCVLSNNSVNDSFQEKSMNTWLVSTISLFVLYFLQDQHTKVEESPVLIRVCYSALDNLNSSLLWKNHFSLLQLWHGPWWRREHVQEVWGQHNVPYAGRTQRGLLLVTLQPPVPAQIFKVWTFRAGCVSVRAFDLQCLVSLILCKQHQTWVWLPKMVPIWRCLKTFIWLRSLTNTSLKHGDL